MSEREIPMNVLKTAGHNSQYQCACGRKFWTSTEPTSNANRVLHNGHTCPKCPECKGVHAGSKLSDFQQAMGETHLFLACISHQGNKCKGKFLGEANSMAEFTMMVGAAMMSMGLPMDGVEIQSIEKDDQEKHLRDYFSVGSGTEMMQHMIAMLMAQGVKSHNPH